MLALALSTTTTREWAPTTDQHALQLQFVLDNRVEWSQKYAVHHILCHCESVAFLSWQSVKTFNIPYIVRGKFNGKYHCCKTRCTLCENYVTDTEEYSFLSSVIFTLLESEFTQRHLRKLLFKFDHFFYEISQKTKVGVFCYWNIIVCEQTMRHNLYMTLCITLLL